MSPLLAASGRTEITPREPCFLAGYSHRDSPWHSIADPLELNALLLRQEERRVLILSADLLWFGSALRNTILDRLEIAPHELLCAASHTHFAPATDPDKPLLGAADARYRDFVADSAVVLGRRLLAEPGRRAMIAYAHDERDLGISRRRRIARLSGETKTVIGPAPEGFTDRSRHVIVVRPEQDTEASPPLAVLWSVGCHPVGFPNLYDASADFPGVGRAAIRKACAADLPVLFLQGCSGDVRPPSVTADRTEFRPFSDEEYARWAVEIATGLPSLVANARAEQPPCLISRRREIPLESLIEGAAPNRTVSIGAVGLTSRLFLIGAGAELVAGYVPLLTGAFPYHTVIVAGCCDSVFGYLPSDAQIAEGGYEVAGFFQLFGLTGRYRSNPEAPVLDAVRVLLEG